MSWSKAIETLDTYLTQFLPARYLAFTVTAFIFVFVLLLDPWTALILLVTGPFLILLLALIGGRAKAITERRFLELSWMSAFFLDILQGLDTLKMFGRSQEQAANIEDISKKFGATTMEVLRTAFQTSLVMEWAATAATAMVAVEVSLQADAINRFLSIADWRCCFSHQSSSCRCDRWHCAIIPAQPERLLLGASSLSWISGLMKDQNKSRSKRKDLDLPDKVRHPDWKMSALLMKMVSGLPCRIVLCISPMEKPRLWLDRVAVERPLFPSLILRFIDPQAGKYSTGRNRFERS